MAVFSLLCVLLPVFAVVLLFLPAIVDLVLQPERVPLWWAGPLAMWGPVVLLTLLVPPLMEPGMGRVVLQLMSFGALHLSIAGALLVLATGLAFSRGLRPGGETLRRRRTTLGAILLMLVLMVVPWLPGLLPMVWVLPPAWAGLLWAVALNRRGPQRLERGKSVSAAFLFASALSFLIGLAHLLLGFAYTNDPIEIGAAAWIVSIATLALLAGGLRWLTGPPAPGPLLAAAASGLTLIFPTVWTLSFRPIPSDIEAPVWVDFAGHAGPSARTFDTLNCLTIIPEHGTARQIGPRCPYSYSEATLVDARVPLSALTMIESASTSFLLYPGRHRTSTWGRYGDRLFLQEQDGVAVFQSPRDGELFRTPLGPELTRQIREQTGDEYGLMVERSPRWTVQDFISMCASMSEPADCILLE